MLLPNASTPNRVVQPARPARLMRDARRLPLTSRDKRRIPARSNSTSQRVDRVLRPQSRASDRRRPHLAAVEVDVRVRDAGGAREPSRVGRDDGYSRAFLSDDDDRARLDDAVKTLTDKDWQFRDKGLGAKGYLEMDGTTASRTCGPGNTRAPASFSTGRFRWGIGSAAQQGAETRCRAADHETRSVLGNFRSAAARNTTCPDGSEILKTTITEYDRRGMGRGAARTCTGTAPVTRPPTSAKSRCGSHARAHRATRREDPAAELAAICKRRSGFPLVAIHLRPACGREG